MIHAQRGKRQIGKVLITKLEEAIKQAIDRMKLIKAEIEESLMPIENCADFQDKVEECQANITDRNKAIVYLSLEPLIEMWTQLLSVKNDDLVYYKSLINDNSLFIHKLREFRPGILEDND